MLALVQNELYTGDAEVAWKHVSGQWPGLERSMLLRFQILRIEATHLWARAALATAAVKGDSDKVRFAEKLAGRIENEQMGWAQPLAGLVRAAVARRRSDTGACVVFLTEAVRGFEVAEMGLYAAAARRRLGETTKGDEGKRLIQEADAWMAKQRVKQPQLITQMLAPGF
jgi:eukaryotic-like serine/threonine-protein kinase